MCNINNECAVCYIPFFIPISNVDESIDEFNTEILDKYENICKNIEENEDEQLSDRRKKRIYKKLLKCYYKRMWYPSYKQYQCSTPKCGVKICHICFDTLRSIHFCQMDLTDVLFTCTHCRNVDWKLYMKEFVFPDLICVALSQIDTQLHYRFPLKLLLSIS
jgi:hypothetical protein